MKDRSAIEWLSEARDYALEAQKLAVDLSQESFDNDRQKQLAVSYCSVVVGEALGQLPKDVQALCTRNTLGFDQRLAQSIGP